MNDQAGPPRPHPPGRVTPTAWARLEVADRHVAELIAHLAWPDFEAEYEPARRMTADARAALAAVRERWTDGAAERPTLTEDLSDAILSAARLRAAFTRFLAARTRARIGAVARPATGPELVFATRVAETLGNLSRPALEGRVVGLLLAGTTPVRLTEISAGLDVSKAALSRLLNEMLERGDLKRTYLSVTREHSYELADHAYLRDLVDRAAASVELARQARRLAADRALADPSVRLRLESFARLHDQVALAVRRLLRPHVEDVIADLQMHSAGNSDSLGPGEARRDQVG